MMLATISERDGLWKVQVRKNRKLKDHFETTDLFALIRWLQQQHPEARLPQSHFANLVRSYH